MPLIGTLGHEIEVDFLIGLNRVHTLLFASISVARTNLGSHMIMTFDHVTITPDIQPEI